MAAALSPADVAYQEAHINQNKGPLVVGISSFLIAITTIVVILRFIARKARSLPYGLDDLFAVIGLFFLICMCVINIVSVQYGLGKHLLATNPATGYIILEAGFFLSIVYAWGNWAIKMSILFLYLRIFTKHLTWFKWSVYFWMFYISGWCFGLFITIVTQCRPLSFFWQQYDIALKPPAVGECSINSNATEISTSALNTVADFGILLLPILVLSQLKLEVGRKIGVMAVFLVGIFACVAGILRLVSTTTAIAVGTDATWNTVDVYLWTAVEASVGLMCACFPIIGPMFIVAHTKFFSLTTRFRKSGGHSDYGNTANSKGPLVNPAKKSSTDGNSSTWSQTNTATGGHDSIDLQNLNHERPSGEAVLRTDEFEVRSEHK